MRDTKQLNRLSEIRKLPELHLLLRHGKLGGVATIIGLLSFVAVVIAHEIRIQALPEYVWGAILSIPVTILCMGLFSVFYEYYIRTTFANSMRSIYWAWDTGVTVFPSHRDAPNRSEVLSRATKQVRLMSTTLSRYFTDVRDLVERKIGEGVQFKFILYRPDSTAIDEKAREEGCDPVDFRDEIHGTCRRYLGPLVRQYGAKVQVRFCDFNTPFGITIVDEREMILSLNVYGLARSKNQTPCLLIENKYDLDSVFKLYEGSFDAIWQKLNDSFPPEVAKYFETDKYQEGAGANHELSLVQRRAYTQLPLEERRKRLVAQADRMIEHYEQESEQTERLAWQGGDIVESE